MPHSGLSPLSVVEYSVDYIIDYVRYITGWNERDEVSRKSQLLYMCGYLKSDHINCKTIVVESDYIERHYLEDYAEYYARCFPAHPRKCSRLHFFSSHFNEKEFTDFLEKENISFSNEINKNYIGFAVIRPIAHTVFARLCLRPYPALEEDASKKILTREVDVSLFGLKLTLHTVPFIEQDKVVSACATSALWVALSANKELSLSALPSPSSITKAATQGGIEVGRTFPTIGLSPMQILKGLKHFNLEPSIVWNAENYSHSDLSISDLQANIYSYLSNDTTIILGGEVYRQDENNYTHLGAHLVCVTGFSTQKSMQEEKDSGQKFFSEKINKLYVHDDRCGPYLRLRTNLQTFSCGDVQWQGMEMSVKNCEQQLFVPTIAMVGLYHKIRIPYIYIRSACEALYFYLYNTWEKLTSLQKLKPLRKLKPFRKFKSLQKLKPFRKLKPFENLNHRATKAIDIILNGYWDITLSTSASIKEEILNTEDFVAYNGDNQRQSILLQNMPRFLWRCKILNQKGQILTDILFDATEVPQGNTMVGYIVRRQDVIAAWCFIDDLISKRIWQSYKVDELKMRESIGCFFKFFSKKQNNLFLNSNYGKLGLPRRTLKNGETDEFQNISQRPDAYNIRRGDGFRNWDFLNKGKKYIWIITDIGDIVLGEDIEINKEYKGHPTLIDGKPGRIAGELFFSKGCWIINARSGAYSSHLRGDKYKSKAYLNNVIKYNLSGLEVNIQD